MAVDVALAADRRHRGQLLLDLRPQRAHRVEVRPVVVGAGVELAAQHRTTTGDVSHGSLRAGAFDHTSERRYVVPGHAGRTRGDEQERGSMSVRDVASDLLAEHDALDADRRPAPRRRRGRCRHRARAGPSPTRSGTSPTSTAPRRWRSPTPTRSRRRRTRCSRRPTAARHSRSARTGRCRPSELLAAWRENRRLLADAVATLADDTRVVWYGPSMGAKSFVTARLMETWAHGQDIVDTVGADRQPTDRLRHVAQIGFITRGWSYVNRGLVPPDVPVFVELTAPSGATWTWGPDDAADRVHGSGGGLLPRRHPAATRRRHRVARRGRRSPGSGCCTPRRSPAPPTDGPAPRAS